ncbi:GyrI-like domain-containing protein [Flavobacterium collinsii]|uniref:GyrI-like domain-containing protein n=1 Tax=Flavobacterium collinsii TaxID=1114861 RepID=UPI0022CABF27|nr:effector binding domain-containing protein [Flavobacterium collinsii]GIQ56893.1 AraC family transcriptional regulator [Flavobacterium collinsii]
MITNRIRSIMLLAFTLLSFTAQSQKQSKTMENPTIQKFYVIGIGTRTINEKGKSAIDIEALWTRFWGEEIQKQIPNKVSDDIYAVYKDYETDFNGFYSLVIGLQVSTLEDIPKGFVGITVETGLYQKYISKGKMPEAVFNTWLEVWQDKSLNRAYKSDFTIHGRKYYDGNSAEVETYISIRD